MNLTARMLSVVSSTISSNLGRTSYGYQDLGKSVAGDDRSGKLERPSPPGDSKEDYGQSWSSCKEYTSYYRNLDTKIVSIQRQELQEHWGQAWDKPHQQQVQWHEHEHAQDAQHLSMYWERVVFVTLWCWVTCISWLKFWVPSCHPCTCACLLEFTSLTLYFDLSFTILSLFFLHMHFEQHTEFDNLIAMQNLRTSANKGSNDAYDVHTSLTGYEPNFMAFSELNDSSGSFSFIIPSSDQDMDDVTLGKLLTEAHRGQADYCDPEGVRVSQSSSSVVFDRAGKPAGERDVDQTIGFGVTRNTYSAHSKFSENTQAEKVVDRPGKLEERNGSNAQKEQRQMIIAEYCEKIGSSRTPSSSCRRRTPSSTRRIMATAKGFSWSSSTKSYRDVGITKIPKFLLSIRSQDENSSRIKTLFWNYQAEYKNYKMEVNCMNDS